MKGLTDREIVSIPKKPPRQRWFFHIWTKD